MQEIFNPLDFRGKKILVTGASSGIGRATAIYLSKLGATLILNGRNEKKLLETLTCLEGESHKTIIADLTNEDLSSLFDEAVQDGMKLSGLVHCAGIPYIRPLKNLKQENLEYVMSVNFYSFIELTRQFQKKKYSNGGSIVVLSSTLAVKPRAYELGYIISKAALNAAVSSLAFELVNKKIRINSIIVGNTNTEMVQETMEKLGNEQIWNQESSGVLLGLAEPSDIASVCTFLLSDMSKYITGRSIFADGGDLS